MAWTAPKDIVCGEVITAAQWNSDIVDNIGKLEIVDNAGELDLSSATLWDLESARYYGITLKELYQLRERHDKLLMLGIWDIGPQPPYVAPASRRGISLKGSLPAAPPEPPFSWYQFQSGELPKALVPGLFPSRQDREDIINSYIEREWNERQQKSPKPAPGVRRGIRFRVGETPGEHSDG